MRIIAGAARGRRLYAPRGLDTRPTADRVREAMFSALAAQVPGARVLDAFAGSGALALEAISRGAAEAWLVEKNRAAAQICARNIALLQAENCRLLNGDVLKALPRLRAAGEGGQFDLVFADPPYNRGLLLPLLKTLLDGSWLAQGAIVAAEDGARNCFSPPQPWKTVKTARYGDTAVYYLNVE